MQNIRKILTAILLSVIALSMIFVMSACDGGSISDVLSLDTPENLRYSGTAVTWDSVSGAGKYLVKVNDGAEISVTTNSFNYSLKSDFTISVKAVTSSGNVMSDAATMTFRYIGEVSNVTLNEDGSVSWLPVDGATSYLVKLDGTEISVGNMTSYSGFAEGSHSVSVRPIVEGDNSCFSSWSPSISVTKLGTVKAESIAYDGEYITFPSVSHASGYNVYINGEILEEGTTVKKIAYDAGSTDFTVTVKAVGNINNKVLDGSESDPKEFVYLDTVTGIRVENGVLKWDAVEKADAYQLKVGNNVVETGLTTNQYNGGKYLVAGRNLEISLKAISSDKSCFSSFSTPVSIFLLESPVLLWNADLSLDGGESSIYWNEINGAIGYEITVTDPAGQTTSYTYGASEAHFAHDYDMVGTYYVTARALADEATDSTYSSLNSQEIVVIRPENLKKSGSGFITSNPTDLSAGFTVTCEHSSKATAYQLYKNDLLINTSTKSQFIVTNLIDENVIDGQEDMYSIKLIGGVRTVGGKITATLNSLETLDFKITILPTPQNVKMEGYKVVYDGVANANNGYAITGAGSASAITETSLSRDLSADLQAGNYNLQVCAKGNGSDVLASNYSPVIRIHRLAAPYDIRIDTDVSMNGILKYSLEDRTASVEIYIDNQLIVSVDDVIKNMNDYIKTTGTGVKMVAVANQLSEDGVYYMSSQASNTKQFIKLSRPTSLTFDNTQLKWNIEGISTAAVGKVTYKIFNESDVLFSAAQNDRAVDISMLEGGKTYNFRIVAVGDGETYINSDYSDVATIYKLETPTVSTVMNSYAWNSVALATSYSVAVDGVIYDTAIHEALGVNFFNPASAFKNVKTYKLTFIAVGDGGKETINSAPLEITQTVKLMDMPDFKIAYSGDVYDKQGKIQISITQTSPYATGYRYSVNNVSEEVLGEGSTYYEHTPGTPGEYTVYVNAIGETFDENGVYLIDSETVGGGAYKIILLGTPSYDSITLNRDGMIQFGAIKNTDGYKYKLVINGSVVYEGTVTTNSVNVAKLISEGKIEGLTAYNQVSSLYFEVYAVGSNSNKVSSESISREWSNVNTTEG